MIFESIIDDITVEDFNPQNKSASEAEVDLLSLEESMDEVETGAVESTNTLNVIERGVATHEETMTAESHDKLHLVMETIAGINGLKTKDIFGDVTEFTTEAEEKEKGSVLDKAKKVGKQVAEAIKKKIAEIGQFITTITSKVMVYITASDDKRKSLAEEIKEAKPFSSKVSSKALYSLLTFSKQHGVKAKPLSTSEVLSDYRMSTLTLKTAMNPKVIMMLARGKVAISFPWLKGTSYAVAEMKSDVLNKIKAGVTVDSTIIKGTIEALNKSKEQIKKDMDKSVKISKNAIKDLGDDADTKVVSEIIRFANHTTRNEIKVMRDAIDVGNLIKKSLKAEK